VRVMVEAPTDDEEATGGLHALVAIVERELA
jgi:hypothetical protein